MEDKSKKESEYKRGPEVGGVTAHMQQTNKKTNKKTKAKLLDSQRFCQRFKT